MSLLVTIILVIVVAILLIAGLEKLAAAAGLNRNLILIVEGLILILAAIFVAQKAGVV
jgi:hypothetical protein